MSDKNLTKHIDDTNKLLVALLEAEGGKYIDEYLSRIFIHDSAGELIVVDLFKCQQCHRIISASQFNFARLCGACDIDKPRPPHYKLVKVNPNQTLSEIKARQSVLLDALKKRLKVKKK